MKILFTAIILLTTQALAKAQLYKSNDKGMEVSFFSKTPMENIDAFSNASTSIINTNNDSVFFKVPIKSFIFKNSLMGEHFNENYLESSKYPYANLRAKIDEDIDFTKDGVYSVKGTGKLLIHGIEQLRTFDATITIKNGDVNLKSLFKVKLSDHKIDVPKIVVKNIAEIIDVELNANYKAFVKK